MPLLESTYKRYQKDGLVILGINYNEDRERVLKFTQEMGVTFPIILDKELKLTRKYGVLSLPATFFIDKKGVKLLYMSALLLYGVLAIVVGLTGFAWASPQFLIGIGVLQAFIYQGVFISFIAIHMNLCWVKVAATQFALYMAWVNLARSLGAGALSGLQATFSYNQMFFVIAVAFFIAAALLWKVNLPAHQLEVRALESA